MARKTKAQRMSELHQLALQQFDDAFLVSQDDRETARISRRFINVRGAAWDWDQSGHFENRMKLEIDHVSNAVEKIRNEYRKNQFSAIFEPADDADGDALIDAAMARYRYDTMNPRGLQARKMAFDCAVEGGIGGLRLRAETERGDYQKICLEPINDPESSLFFDANAQLQDKSDAEHAFHIVPWSKRAYIAEYGEDGASWPDGITFRPKFDWYGPDVVTVAEYFRCVDERITYRTFTGPSEEQEEFREDELDDDAVADLLAQGFTEGEPRVEELDRIEKYVMNGARILSGPEVIPGRNIPLIPQYGVRTVIDHAERFYGRVAKAMDAQIVYNIQVSKVAENAAASSIEKPIFSPEQIGPYADMWQRDNTDNNAFLLINAVRDAAGNPMPTGPLGYTKSPDVPPAVGALISLTRQDIADQMGNPENAEMMQPDTSGIALDLVQGRIDMGSYGYMDNAADAERRVAEVWLGMAAEIYVEPGRKLKGKTEDGKPAKYELGKMILDAKTGRMVPEIDFSRVAKDVTVNIGPVSSSRRSAIVRTLSSLMGTTADPEMAMMLGHMALMNIEGEGLTPLREYSRKKMIALGVIKPTKAEEDDMAAEAAKAGPQEPDPQALLAKSLAMEAEAKAMKAQADTMLAQARTKESEAKAAETLAGIPLKQQDQALKTAQAIAGELNAGQ